MAEKINRTWRVSKAVVEALEERTGDGTASEFVEAAIWAKLAQENRLPVEESPIFRRRPVQGSFGPR